MGTHSTLSLSLVYCRPFVSDVYVGHGTEQGVVGEYGGGGEGGGRGCRGGGSWGGGGGRGEKRKKEKKNRNACYGSSPALETAVNRRE